MERLFYLCLAERTQTCAVMLPGIKASIKNKLVLFLQKRQTYIFSATLTTVHHGPNRKNAKSVTEAPTKNVKLDKLVKKIGMKQKPYVVDLTTVRSLIKQREFFFHCCLNIRPCRGICFLFKGLKLWALINQTFRCYKISTLNC